MGKKLTVDQQSVIEGPTHMFLIHYQVKSLSWNPSIKTTQIADGKIVEASLKARALQGALL